jgi:3-methyl-2-oxobutanoate hydroxymethyltransferase
MAHVGLGPQNIHQLGGYKVQRDEARLLRDAQAAAQAGAFAVVLECIPGSVAERITSELAVPTIGIGAGAACDGQVLVTHDVLGITCGYTPRFVRHYAQLGQTMTEAVQAYCRDVRLGEFPSSRETYQ